MYRSRPLFRLFNTVDSKQMFDIKVCRWLDSNHGPLMLKAIALPTEPQPQTMLIVKNSYYKIDNNRIFWRLMQYYAF